MPRTIDVSLKELKIALSILPKSPSNISDWAKGLRNPQGETVHRTLVYKALDYGQPQWVLDEIASTVRKAKEKYPEHFAELLTERTKSG